MFRGLDLVQNDIIRGHGHGNPGLGYRCGFLVFDVKIFLFVFNTGKKTVNRHGILKLCDLSGTTRIGPAFKG